MANSDATREIGWRTAPTAGRFIVFCMVNGVEVISAEVSLTQRKAFEKLISEVYDRVDIQTVADLVAILAGAGNVTLKNRAYRDELKSRAEERKKGEVVLWGGGSVRVLHGAG